MGVKLACFWKRPLPIKALESCFLTAMKMTINEYKKVSYDWCKVAYYGCESCLE
jgi:hypothetical protein